MLRNPAPAQGLPTKILRLMVRKSPCGEGAHKIEKPKLGVPLKRGIGVIQGFYRDIRDI